MKKIILSLALAASVAQAQTPATTTAAPAPEAPVQTTATTAAAATVPEKSPVGLNIFFEFGVGVQDLRDQENKTMVDSVNGLGVTYKISDKYKAELRHNYGVKIISDREQVKKKIGSENVAVLDKDGNQKLDKEGKAETQSVDVFDYDNPYTAFDPTIHLSVKTAATVLGSKPLSVGTRFYVPMSKASVLNNSLGILRADVAPAWDLSTKVSLDFLVSTRLYLNRGSELTAKRGSDSELRFITGPTLSYNFNDNVSLAYNPYMDIRTTGHQRGRFAKADVTNDLYNNIGMTVAMGGYTINPYWETKATRAADTEGYKGGGVDENSSYGLFLQAIY